ncbi:MAG: hypothetical protein AAF934_06275 [Bacteroidota bacterium]
MNLLGSILLIVGGILAASAYIVSKKPEAEKLIANLMPFTGWIGIFMFAWGIWAVFDLIFNLDRHTALLKIDPVWGVISILFVPFVAVVTGFMLGFALVARWIPGQGRGEAQLLTLRKKLIRITTPLGLLAILAGIVHLLKLLF